MKTWPQIVTISIHSREIDIAQNVFISDVAVKVEIPSFLHMHNENTLAHGTDGRH